MLFISCFIIHLTTSPKLRVSAATDYQCRYSLSFNLLSSSYFNSVSVRFNIDIFLLMIWPFCFCLGFSPLIIYLIYCLHFIKFLPSNLIFLNIFITALFVIRSHRDIRNIIWDVASCSFRL